MKKRSDITHDYAHEEKNVLKKIYHREENLFTKQKTFHIFFILTSTF